MPIIRTKRWDDPAEPADGTRILVCRYRPRGVAKTDETWHVWYPQLGPSKDLHARAYGRGGNQATWDTYCRAYRREMAGQQELIAELAARVAGGEVVTLLCSSACDRESRCHRILLRDLILQQTQAAQSDNLA